MKFGTQLYTFRNQCKNEKGVAKVLSYVAGIGAETIQISGVCDLPPKTFKKLADDNGLTIAGTHTPFEKLLNKPEEVSEAHHIYGAEIVGLGSMPQKYRTSLEGIKEFEDIANNLIETYAKYGLKFAYHNHSFELETKYEGKTILDHLIEECDPRLQFILDTYWIRFSGNDVVEYMKKMSGRLDLIHLKDYKNRIFRTKMCEVGYGDIDFKKVIQTAKECNTQNAVVELDICFNPYRSMKKSIEYINTNLKDLVK